MKNSILFFVSCLALAFLSGCTISHSRPGVISTRSILGSNVEFGYTEKSDVTVCNPYNLSMEVKLQVIEYPHWAFRGDGNDPLLGTPARPRVVWQSRSFTSFPAERIKTIAMNRIVLERQYVAVLVTWYDAQGRYQGKSSDVFCPGNPYYPWHWRSYPSMGRFGQALYGDIISIW